MVLTINSLRTGGDLCHQGQDTEFAPKIKFYQNIITIMTIQWKALEEHFLMVPLFF
jgi:hypothetical protein